MASQEIYIAIPGSDIKLYPGYKIKLNRFDSDLWTVHYGWFDFSGNRPMLGWYLTNDSDSNSVKPVQKTDLYDIYLVDTSTIEGITVDVVQSDYAENSTVSASYIQNRPYFTETFDELNSRYFPHSVGTADIGLSFMRFDNITISLVDAQPYVVTINLGGRLGEIVAGNDALVIGALHHTGEEIVVAIATPCGKHIALVGTIIALNRSNSKRYENKTLTTGAKHLRIVVALLACEAHEAVNILAVDDI